MWETWVQSLDWEDPMEKGKATHSSILAWRVPWTVSGHKESDTTERIYLDIDILQLTYSQTNYLLVNSVWGSAFQVNAKLCRTTVQFSSVQLLSRVRLFATPWIADARPPCPSQTPGVYPNSCPSSRWCHPAISSSVIPFSSCPQSLPASGSFPMNQLFAWGGQRIGVSASASVLPMNTQGWSPMVLVKNIVSKVPLDH